MKRRICVVSGSRADYGLLRWTIDEIQNDPDLDLLLVVTGSHLLLEYGASIREIELDGFVVDHKVDIVDSSDTAHGIAQSIGRGVIGFSAAFSQLTPDVVLLLGDRYEIFSAATAATALHIPIAHCHGGERTEGALDEALRHSVTKMAHLHFTSTNEYSRRVIQLGEDPDRVFTVGSFGVEGINRLPLLGKSQLEERLGQRLEGQVLLVMIHPETHSPGSNEQLVRSLFSCLDQLVDTRVIFTLSNVDEEGRFVNKLIEEYVLSRPWKASFYANLGQKALFSLMCCVDGVVGNSSSGIIEAPSFNVGTVNIGDRQKGRLRGESIIDCKPNRDSIARGLEILLSEKFKNKVKSFHSPYKGSGVSKKVTNILKTYPLDAILVKEFYDVSFDET